MSDLKMDVRLMPHRIRAGTLTREEIRSHLDKLPDEAALAEETHTRLAQVAQGRRGGRR